MRIPRYKEPASSLAEAKSRAAVLAAYLTQYTGAEWEPKFHENLGFWWKAQLGPITVHAEGSKHNLNTWTIMNSGPSWDRHPGTGHSGTTVIYASSEDAILVGVKDSIKQLIKIKEGWESAIAQVHDTILYKELIG